MKGMVADIQRFSLHDGPGIRSTVFLKGCSLRCGWCHNPETLNPRQERMVFADGRQVIAGKEMSVAEVMAEVEQDVPFYERSGGGVTLSGGEPLVQAGFCEALLRALKGAGISTAVQSCLGCRWESVERLLPGVDLWMVDVKHLDAVKHREGTGKGNGEILANVRRLSEAGADLWIRTPVIPGWNDRGEDIRALAEWVRALPQVSGFELLPFHPLGTDKYRALGRAYPMEGVQMLSEEKMNFLKETAATVLNNEMEIAACQ